MKHTISANKRFRNPSDIANKDELYSLTYEAAVSPEVETDCSDS